jgi:1-acyl-sn-glycerol-3-phosphate acyltransferase
LFPEGTRVKEGEDSTGKTGAIMLALRTGTPILPCYCEKRKHLFQRTAVVFGEPYMVEIEGKKASPKEYKERAEELIQRIYALKEQVK